MGIRSPFDRDSSSSHIVDKMIGNAYPTVRAVYDKLDEIAYLVENTGAILSAGNAATAVLEDFAGPVGAVQVGYSAGELPFTLRTVDEKLKERISITDAGALVSASTAVNDLAIATAIGQSNEVWVPDGIFTASLAAVPYLKDLDGPGFISIAGVNFPAGNVESNLTIPFPAVFSNFADIFAYLSTRSIRSTAEVTIAISAGNHISVGAGIEPYHPDGARIRIIGSSSLTTTLQFTGLGAATGKAGIRLVGPYFLGLLDGVTIDGANWNGHSSGGPTLGGGDPNDPIGIQAKNGASITLGADVKVRRFARNGIFAYQGSTIKADYAVVTECGSDAFVASTGSNVRAIGAKAIDCWGVGFYADYTGVIWATGAEATGIKLRLPGSGGDGFGANFSGTIFAENSVATMNADTGYTTFAGTLILGGATAGGSALLANAGYGLRCQSGARAVGTGFESSYNGSGGITVSGGASFVGDGAVTNFNTGTGVTVTDGAVVASAGLVSNSNTEVGLLADRGAHASITGCDIQSNGSNGIECHNSTVRATSAVAVKNNSVWGVLARIGGIVDMQAVSEATVVTGNTLGAFSPAKDTDTGAIQSYIYASA